MKFLRLLAVAFLLISAVNAHEIGPSNFDRTIKSHKYVLVKFWASWCGPCQMLKPEFEKAKRVAGNKVYFATYNIDLRGEPLSRYNVSMIPTMILFVDGKEVDRSNSVLSSSDIVSWVLGYVPQ